MTRDPIEYPFDAPGPRWFTYAVHWVNKHLFCSRRGHTVTDYRSCNTCGEYVL